MGKHKSPRTVSPHAVATISSVLLLIVSAGLGFYFTELRGPGVRTLLAGSQASELLVLFGGLAAVILTGHLAVANGTRSAQGASTYRKLVRRASEVDYSDPQAVSQFDGVPELRDMVNVLVTEKQQGQELLDTLESVRGENQGLVEGMERSLEKLGKIREDQPSAQGQKLASLWNSLLERVAANDADVAKVPSNNVEGLDLSDAQGDSTSVAPVVEQRLQDLEERVQQLQSSLAPVDTTLLVTEDPVDVSSSPLWVTDDEPVDVASSPLLVAEEELVAPVYEPLLATTQEPIAPVVSPALEPEVVATVTPQVEPVTAPAPIAVPWIDTPTTSPAQGEGAQDEVVGRAPTAAAMPWQETPAQLKSEPVGVAEVNDNSAEENSFSEWSGTGFAALTEEPVSPSVGFGEAPQALESAPAAQEEFAGLQLPKFAPQKTQDVSDHVEVTYNAPEPAELPEDALLFDAPQEAVTDDVVAGEFEEEVVDLTSLGAVEYKE